MMPGPVVRLHIPEETRKAAAKILDEVATASHVDTTGGDSGGTAGMSLAERLSRLEGDHEGLKQSQSILKAGVMGFGALVLGAVAVVIALQVFTYSRIDRVESKVDSLPGELRNELLGVVNAISTAVTATKASPPQIIIVPQGASNTPQQ